MYLYEIVFFFKLVHLCMFSMNLFEHNVSFAGREKLSAMPAGGAAPAAAAAAAPAAAAAEEKKGQFCTLLPLS